MTVQQPPPSQRPAAGTPPRRSASPAKTTTVGGVVLAVLVAFYALVQPVLNERLGWQLPGVDRLVEDQGGVVDGESELLYGILSDLGDRRYRSPAGLMYVPGSQEGHRLKHLERHTVDDPGRPGSHGVFDGGMAAALVVIDKAYRKAQAGVQTTVREVDGRTVYTVDMGTRIGYVGGSEGKRRKNPLARRLRLVLDRDRVITAYPM